MALLRKPVGPFLPAKALCRFGHVGHNLLGEMVCFENDSLPSFSVRVDHGMASVSDPALRLHLSLAWAAAELDCVSDFAPLNKSFTINTHKYTLRLVTVSQQPPTPPPSPPPAP